MTCPLCQDTGYLKRGMVVSPWYADDYVDWCLNLVACSHPASPESPVETNESRTAAVGVVGGVHGGEVASHRDAPEGGPATSPDVRWLLPDVVVEDMLTSPDPWVREQARQISAHDGEPATGGAP